MAASAQYPERFADYSRTCMAKLDGTETRTLDPGQHPAADRAGEPVEVEVPRTCRHELTFRDHYRGMQHLDGYSSRVHVLRCPVCKTKHGVCPVCTGEDGAPGWYRGDSTGDMLACHCCNAAEAERQRRDPFR